ARIRVSLCPLRGVDDDVEIFIKPIRSRDLHPRPRERTLVPDGAHRLPPARCAPSFFVPSCGRPLRCSELASREAIRLARADPCAPRRAPLAPRRAPLAPRPAPRTPRPATRATSPRGSSRARSTLEL